MLSRITALKPCSRFLRSLSYYQWQESVPADSVRHDPSEVFEAGVRQHHTANTAYPIGHQKTIRQYRVKRTRDQTDIKRVLEGAFGSLDEMMLYVHVPFCHTRCQFCEYTVVDPKHGRQPDVQQLYFDALLREFDLYRDVIQTTRKRLVGFDIGGGTPSMASTANIEKVMNKARDCFQFAPFEASIETTPAIAANEPDKIAAYKQMGIDRISMGLQTMDFELARKLGRNDKDYVSKAVENIRKAGFQSFNIDLMYGFPVREGRHDMWGQTVRDTIALNPEHITLYRMRYKGTRMIHVQNRVGLDQVNAQEGEARKILEQNGYNGWMGKNTYSRIVGSSGCSAYLERRVLEGIPYIGLGLGAQSYSRHTLSYNLGAVTKKMFQYLKSVELGRIPIQDLYHLSLPHAIGKFCAVSFYFGGIHRRFFKNNFGIELDDYFKREIAFLKEHKLMEDVDNGNRLGMTAAGKRHFGGVVALFYSPAVQKHLIELDGGDPFKIPVGQVLGDMKPAIWPPIISAAGTPTSYAPVPPVVDDPSQRPRSPIRTITPTAVSTLVTSGV